MTKVNEFSLFPNRRRMSEDSAQRHVDDPLDEFFQIIKQFRAVSLSMLTGAGAVPFFAYLAQIAPPWPPGVMLLTALVELIALIAVFYFFPSPRRPRVGM